MPQQNDPASAAGTTPTTAASSNNSGPGDTRAGSGDKALLPDLPSPSSLPNQTKDSPLTDIGTSPPPFEMPPLDMPPLQSRGSSRDSYESSELSDLGDDESEAETDKMDFLNETSPPADAGSDLHRLSNLSELARLQELDDSDSDDAPDRYAANLSPQDEPPSKRRKGNVEPAPEPVKDEASENEAAELNSNSANSREVASNNDASEQGPEQATEQVSEPEASEHEASENDESHGSNVSASAAARLEEVENAHQDVSAKHIPDVEVKSEVPESEADLEDGNTADVEDAKQEETKEPETNPEEPEEDLDLDEHREVAVQELIAIENDFSFLRDKLFQDKLQLLERELQLCLEGSHPELLQLYYKFNEFYQDNITLANATLNYSLKCINNETIATRTGIHQNFMKDLADSRNEMITHTTSLWYKINKEWNYLDSAMADYNYTALPSLTPEAMTTPMVAGGNSLEYYQDGAVNKKLARQNTVVELVHRRNCLNEQLGILNGLKEFHGLPCAVSGSLLDEDVVAEELLLRKASPEEIKEDLQAMGIY